MTRLGRRLLPVLAALLATALAAHYLFLLASALREQETRPAGEGPAVVFNERLIEGVSSSLDLEDPDAVFRAVFAALPDVVDVYPTENYYYFQLLAAGRTIWGNLRLDASDRDQGLIHLGYFRFDESARSQDREGIQKTYAAAEGVRVERLEPLRYAVSYAGKRVVFRLNDQDFGPPASLRLRESEEYVGPVFDESGLRFSLIFDTGQKHFMYMLNDEGGVPEELEEVGPQLLAGRRTGFVFYDDAGYLRRILVAVHGRNWDRNNYYDGPFDQLPDNHVERSNISRYIPEAYPYAAGQIDAFGGYRDDPGARVLVAPYYVYYTDEDLAFVDSCRRSALPEGEFYKCITPDFQEPPPG